MTNKYADADAKLLAHIVSAKAGILNLCGSAIGIRELELILMALKYRPDGTLTIQAAGGVMSMLELGAYLNSIAAEGEK